MIERKKKLYGAIAVLLTVAGLGGAIEGSSKRTPSAEAAQPPKPLVIEADFACDTSPDILISVCTSEKPEVFMGMECQPCVVDSRNREITQWCQAGWGFDTDRCPNQWEQWQAFWYNSLVETIRVRK